MFDANHFHIEATLDITDSDKLSKHSSYFYKKGYIQSKGGSHIITGVPLLISMCIIAMCGKVVWQILYITLMLVYTLSDDLNLFRSSCLFMFGTNLS